QPSDERSQHDRILAAGHLSFLSSTHLLTRYVPAFSRSHFFAASGNLLKSCGGVQPSLGVRLSAANAAAGVTRSQRPSPLPQSAPASASRISLLSLASIGSSFIVGVSSPFLR